MLLKRVGINTFSIDVMRHIFATRALEQGMDFKTLSVIMGHSDIKVTMSTHAYVLSEFQRESMEKLDELYI